MDEKWSFWCDRGGTFTDVIAQSDSGNINVYKLLSQSHLYSDSISQAVKSHFQIINGHESKVTELKIGSTLTTNALLEEKGQPTVLVVTQGFEDAIEIGFQARQDIFKLKQKPKRKLFSEVISVDERVDAQGAVIRSLDEELLRWDLNEAKGRGMESICICLVHSYINPQHETQICEIAKQIGFKNIVCSANVQPLINFVKRSQTSLVEAYLDPLLSNYVSQLKSEFEETPLYFMQSHGGLCIANEFKSSRSLLSGPAGGIVGAVKSCQVRGIENIITFDMGGTSTDVALYNGELETQIENEIDGVHLNVPMLKIHTVAAGGGSLLKYKESRFTVGPESGGAQPGPLSYGLGGQLTVTDANLFLGRIQSSHFPKIFGPSGDESLNTKGVKEEFLNHAKELKMSAEDVAFSYLYLACENMAEAIKKISIDRGHNPKDFTLCAFGGAGGQVSCLVAEILGMEKIYVPPYASLLSALGIGLADESSLEQKFLDLFLDQEFEERKQQLRRNYKGDKYKISYGLHFKNSDSVLLIRDQCLEKMKTEFLKLHKKEFGFTLEDEVKVKFVEIKKTQPGARFPDFQFDRDKDPSKASFYNVKNKKWEKIPLYKNYPVNEIIGPGIVCLPHTTVVIDQGWKGVSHKDGGFELTQTERDQKFQMLNNESLLLEIYSQKFMAIAEQMGVVLQKTSQSVNIKERLDFSCAIFDHQGHLLANAPHMPVHLGSMEMTVKNLLEYRNTEMREGQVFLTNSPYEGGTHLPDLTVITPVFAEDRLCFFVASRGHHGDIGGVTPGSMPSSSRHIEEEGLVFKHFLMAEDSEINIKELKNILSNGPYPARNPETNINDLKAQLSSNQRGVLEIQEWVKERGLDEAFIMTQEVLNLGERCILKVLAQLQDGKASLEMDNGSKIQVRVQIKNNKQSTLIDFSGSSEMSQDNFNAPEAVTYASVLYVLRSLMNENIPLNSGCLRPIEIKIPKPSILSPKYPAPVVAGNVETSQVITDVLLLALKQQACSQGTMNNLTYGNDRYQYYETICGGAGAGPQFEGESHIQTHMTNSRLTDVEVLESKFPVMVTGFSRRYGSFGDGEKTGGDGVIRSFKFLEEMQVNLLSNRRLTHPLGLKGGGEAQPGVAYILQQEKLTPLSGRFQKDVLPGDELFIQTPGGGGYGSPICLKRHLYFAFGSNLDEKQLLQRCPDSQIQEIAFLTGHRLHFSFYSENRKGGVADIVTDANAVTWGLVVALTDQDLQNLDQIECLGQHYDRIQVVVNTINGKTLDAWTYRGRDEIRDPVNVVMPTIKYRKQIEFAHRKFGFPTTDYWQNF